MAVSRNEKKMQILRAYQEVIHEYGIEGASFSKIAAQAHIPSSLIFYYFENKEALTCALVEYFFDSLYQQGYPPTVNRTLNTPEEQFEDFLVRLLGTLENKENGDNNIYYSCAALAASNDSIRKAFRDGNNKGLRNIEEGLRYFSELGMIRVENMRTAVLYINVLLDGLDSARNFFQEDEEDLELLYQDCRKQVKEYLQYRGEE